MSKEGLFATIHYFTTNFGVLVFGFSNVAGKYVLFSLHIKRFNGVKELPNTAGILVLVAFSNYVIHYFVGYGPT